MSVRNIISWSICSLRLSSSYSVIANMKAGDRSASVSSTTTTTTSTNSAEMPSAATAASATPAAVATSTSVTTATPAADATTSAATSRSDAPTAAATAPPDAATATAPPAAATATAPPAAAVATAPPAAAVATTATATDTATTSEKRPKFGTRYLEDESKVFDCNAWDHVEWTEEQEANAKTIVSAQASNPVPFESACEFLSRPADYWDAFYSTHDRKFFMDRNWLFTEFPELLHAAGGADDSDECSYSSTSASEQAQPVSTTGTALCNKPRVVLEVGCGAGNTVFPLLESCNDASKLFVYCCDYSPTAVAIVKAHEKFRKDQCNAFVCDISKRLAIIGSLTDPTPCPCVAHPLFKFPLPTSAKFDMTQLRFKKGRKMDAYDSLYARGDGTLVYYFTEDELHQLFTKCGLVRQQNMIDRRLLVNRAKQTKMYRIWLQCKYVKKPAVL